MSGFNQLDGNALSNIQFMTIWHGLEELASLFDCVYAIKRFERRQMLFCSFAIFALGVFFLNLGGISHHQLRDPGGRLGAIDGSLVTLRCQQRQTTAVIQMSVSQNNGVKRVWLDSFWYVVEPLEFFRSLEHAAINQKATTSLGTGGRKSAFRIH